MNASDESGVGVGGGVGDTGSQFFSTALIALSREQ
jgi:hypothetical protein